MNFPKKNYKWSTVLDFNSNSRDHIHNFNLSRVFFCTSVTNTKYRQLQINSWSFWNF